MARPTNNKQEVPYDRYPNDRYPNEPNDLYPMGYGPKRNDQQPRGQPPYYEQGPQRIPYDRQQGQINRPMEPLDRYYEGQGVPMEDKLYRPISGQFTPPPRYRPEPRGYRPPLDGKPYDPRGPPPQHEQRGPPFEPRGAYDPRGFEPRGYEPRGYDPRGYEPRGYEPRGGPYEQRRGPPQFEPRGGPYVPREPPYEPRGGPPPQYDPRGGPPPQYDPRGGPPPQYDPRRGPQPQYDPRGPPPQYAPRGGLPQYRGGDFRPQTNGYPQEMRQKASRGGYPGEFDIRGYDPRGIDPRQERPPRGYEERNGPQGEFGRPPIGGGGNPSYNQRGYDPRREYGGPPVGDGGRRQHSPQGERRIPVEQGFSSPQQQRIKQG